MSAWSYPGPLLLYASCRALLGLPFSLPGGFDDMFSSRSFSVLIPWPLTLWEEFGLLCYPEPEAQLSFGSVSQARGQQ